MISEHDLQVSILELSDQRRKKKFFHQSEHMEAGLVAIANRSLDWMDAFHTSKNV